MTDGMEVVPPASKKSGRQDGWDFYENGIWMSGPDRPALVKKIIDYREANNLPIGNPNQEVINFNAAKSRPVNAPRIDPTLRELVVKWLDSKLKIKSGFVSVEEADRRAAICATCPHNIVHWREGEKCANCVANANRATAIILQGRKQHRPLGACDMIKQNNTAAVWLDDRSINNPSLPTFCWRREV